VVLAGGASRRFGTDKALALLHGRPLILHALEALRAQADVVAVSGREWPGVLCLPDWPGPGLGPAGGLLGALRHAGAQGFTAVLTIPVDAYPVPGDLAARLHPGPAVATEAPVIGMWPAGLAGAVEALVEAGERRMHRIAACLGARTVACVPHCNINRPGDLVDAENRLWDVMRPG
jgi:molybdopterin-guanine dinucleotide biosynthesis protein A